MFWLVISIDNNSQKWQIDNGKMLDAIKLKQLQRKRNGSKNGNHVTKSHLEVLITSSIEHRATNKRICFVFLFLFSIEFFFDCLFHVDFFIAPKSFVIDVNCSRFLSASYLDEWEGRYAFNCLKDLCVLKFICFLYISICSITLYEPRTNHCDWGRKQFERRCECKTVWLLELKV